MKVSEDDRQREKSSLQETYIVLRNRVLSGFFLALPIFLTFMIISWVYNRIVRWVMDPIYRFVVGYWMSGDIRPREADIVDLPFWIEFVAAPVISLAIFLAILFLLGMFFKSRVHLALDWLLLKVPFVNWVYALIVKVVNTMRSDDANKPKFKRVVLVQFPHAGMRAPAFVTNSCKDESTGKTILCVYVPTTPVPTSGYMLLVPEEEVTELSWDLQETLEAIVSGGVSAPPRVDYFPATDADGASS